MKTQHSFQRVSIAGMRPLALTKKQIIAVLGSAKLVDRMLWATRHAKAAGLSFCGKAETFLSPRNPWKRRMERLVGGELPPLMPSERVLPE